MRTISIKFWPLTLLFMISSLSLMSCGENELDPIFEELDMATLPSTVLGSYTGVLQYSGTSGKLIVDVNATATLKKSGNTYTIEFSRDIPAITNRRFIEENASYMSIDPTNIASVISIKNGEITIQLSKGGENYQFAGKK